MGCLARVLTLTLQYDFISTADRKIRNWTMPNVLSNGVLFIFRRTSLDLWSSTRVQLSRSPLSLITLPSCQKCWMVFGKLIRAIPCLLQRCVLFSLNYVARQGRGRIKNIFGDEQSSKWYFAKVEKHQRSNDKTKRKKDRWDLERMRRISNDLGQRFPT